MVYGWEAPNSARPARRLSQGGTGRREAFRQLPEPVAPPQLCYQQLIRGGTHRVRLTDAPGQVAAAMVTVTPPRIPVLMPGESVGAPDGPLLRYLTALESFDRRFLGFRSETHGVTVEPGTGDYLIECLRPATYQQTRTAAPERRAATPAQRSHPQESRRRS
ncbi:hypothetical protein ACFYO2_44485 [Streptomyces sp. NPDC006602]|uniref:Orn/Lys/Arg family decarboxylase n=1 Tax=Streptomyces sp. NPDC006602 TaxID=3364751 RepID=UPI003686C235